MHPTLNAMVAAEREVEVARAVQRRSHVDLAASPTQLGTAPRADASLSIRPIHALAAAGTALAQLLSRPIASESEGTTGPEVCRA